MGCDLCEKLNIGSYKIIKFKRNESLYYIIIQLL